MSRLRGWLGVAALLLQVLLPLSAPQPAWVEQGLFPPTCSVHHAEADVGAVPANPSDCRQCPLCQASAGDRLVPAPRQVAAVAYDGIAYGDLPLSLPHGTAASASPPSRGPPSAA